MGTRKCNHPHRARGHMWLRTRLVTERVHGAWHGACWARGSACGCEERLVTSSSTRDCEQEISSWSSAHRSAV
jgi:hypothetical protein